MFVRRTFPLTITILTIIVSTCLYTSEHGPVVRARTPEDKDSFTQSTYNIHELVRISEIQNHVFDAAENSVYFVPTGNIYDISALYAFYAYKQTPQNIAHWQDFDNDGKPKFIGNIVAFGGRFANRVVKYYEDAGIAAVGKGWNGTHHLFTSIADESTLYAVDDSMFNPSEKDYFVIQSYKDGDRYVFSEWGFREQGTYAGGACFIDIIYPNLQDYTNQYYIYSWTDLNDDDMPQPDEIILEATGAHVNVAWENPYEDWGKPGYSLLGGQGEHLHTISFSKNPDANIEMETILDIFSQNNWSPTYWATRGVHVGGYENTNGGYEWIMVGAHNHRRTDDQYKELLEFTEQNAPRYGYEAVIRASEVYPPHEGMIWNGLCRGGYETYPNAFTANNKSEFVSKVVSAENDQHHSIAVVLHPQAGGMSGRNNLSDALAMVQAGAELIEIFNGCWESGDDLCVNDHYRTGSTNMGPSPAVGNTEDYLTYNVTGSPVVYTARADGNAENYWDHILSQGYRVWGCGCDDFHGRRRGIEPEYKSHNWGGNYVWMEILAPSNPEPEDLVRCLERGSFYVTQGVQIQSIEVTNDLIRIVGDSSVDFIEAIGSVGGPVALGELNQGDGDSGTLLKRSFGNVMEYTPDPNSPYDDLYVRFRLVNTDYDENYYYDEHGDGGGDVYAWTQPFYKKPPQTGGN